MRNRKTWFWILCAALVVCIAVVCIILFTGKESAGKRQSQITTNAGTSQDASGKQDANDKQNANSQSGANGQQNGGNASGGVDSFGQAGDADIDYPYVDIPAEPDDDTPAEQASGDTPVTDLPGGDIVDNNSSGDIVLPMVP